MTEYFCIKWKHLPLKGSSKTKTHNPRSILPLDKVSLLLRFTFAVCTDQVQGISGHVKGKRKGSFEGLVMGEFDFVILALSPRFMQLFSLSLLSHFIVLLSVDE